MAAKTKNRTRKTTTLAMMTTLRREEDAEGEEKRQNFRRCDCRSAQAQAAGHISICGVALKVSPHHTTVTSERAQLTPSGLFVDLLIAGHAVLASFLTQSSGMRSSKMTTGRRTGRSCR
ncbi:hypothetical protein TYRP_023790 [Tyrophagus putrescentiae]|nr:hypothetical protein TYRP_023790 [Tyrophagus putrescentiae]